MKRFTKLCLILGAVLFVLGLGVSAAGYASGAITDLRDTGNTAPGNTEILDIPTNGLVMLDMDLVSEDVTFLPSSDGNLHIEYIPNQNYKYEYGLERSSTTQEDTYYFRSSGDVGSFQWSNLMQFRWADNADRITVYLPEYLSVSVETTSGDISTQNITAGTLHAATASGEILLQSISVETLELSSSSGDVTAGQSAVSGNVSISTVSGETKAENLSTVGTLHIKSTSGEVELSSVSVDAAGDAAVELSAISGNLSLENVSIQGNARFFTTSGDIVLEPAAIYGNIYAESSSGNVSLELTDAPPHRMGTVASHSGSVSIQGGDERSTHTISVSTTSGDIDIWD